LFFAPHDSERNRLSEFRFPLRALTLPVPRDFAKTHGDRAKQRFWASPSAFFRAP